MYKKQKHPRDSCVHAWNPEIQHTSRQCLFIKDNHNTWWRESPWHLSGGISFWKTKVDTIGLASVHWACTFWLFCFYLVSVMLSLLLHLPDVELTRCHYRCVPKLTAAEIAMNAMVASFAGENQRVRRTYVPIYQGRSLFYGACP